MNVSKESGPKRGFHRVKVTEGLLRKGSDLDIGGRRWEVLSREARPTSRSFAQLWSIGSRGIKTRAFGSNLTQVRPKEKIAIAKFLD